MTEGLSRSDHELTAQDRRALDRLLVRIARNAEAIEQVLDTVELLGSSGAIAGLNAALDEFDDNFSAATRPELMSMIANGMMLLGMLSELRYQPFFDLAMHAPAVMNEAYPRFRQRRDKLGLREAIDLLRSPEIAAALELLVAVLRAQRGGSGETRPAFPRTSRRSAAG
jgi:uncharacterized protein YjgD (DUF1641 family)